MPSLPRRILVIRRRALGDLLVSLPVLEHLRRIYPKAELTLLVDAPLRAVAALSPAVDEVLSFDRRALRGIPARLAWLRRLRAAHYDLVLDLHGTPQTARWCFWSGAPMRVGRERRWRSWAYNRLLRPTRGEPPRFAGEVFLDWIRALGEDPGVWAPAKLKLPSWRGVREAAPRILLNPSATWSAKAWPQAHWSELARLCAQEFAARVELVWGPGEEPLRDAILSSAGAAATALPPTDLPQLAAELADCDLLVSGDSGPKHLAVAVGVPTLTLFGSTNPLGWQPPGEMHRALFVAELACRPCDLRLCPVAGHPCLDTIAPSSVLAQARQLLHAAKERGHLA